MLNKMINAFGKIKVNNENIDNVSAFQSKLVKSVIDIGLVTELNALIKNINFSLNNIESDLQMMEKKFSQVRLKELYEKGLEQLNNTTEKYFLQKLKNYNDTTNKKSSSQTKKEVKALLMAIVSKEKYEQISDEFRAEVDIAMKNIVKGKIRLFSGLDKQTYDKAKKLSNNIENDEYTPLNIEMKSILEETKKENISNDIVCLSEEEISYNETTLLNLNNAGNELGISKNQAQSLGSK